MTTEPENSSRNKFGTFGGVFTPSILTIFGVIMFMRANYVIGQAGIIQAVAILFIAKAITLLTSLSVSAIATNMQVRGGGAYFMISRVLGPEFGGAIGIALFFAQALSVPFYLLGFSEALVRSYPAMEPHFQTLAIVSGIILFAVSYIGAGWAIKAQYLIMAVLGLSIFAFMGGAVRDFSTAVFTENLKSGYTALEGGGGNYGFWLVFAIYFPAVTGILAGINMSGDLKDPSRSIPSGTLWAVGFGALVYLIQMLICGGAFSREAMIAQPYQTLKNGALFGMGYLVAAGVFAATLSSALGSFLGAPRILQAVSRDKILNFLEPFGKGSGVTDEPRRALILTGIITIGVFLWSGNSAGGAALNAVASVITMFFLYTYGMVNMAAFIEAFGGNPSFRPKFGWFHWSGALLGAIGCVAAALLIDTAAAVAAVVIIALMLWHIRSRELSATFGDARRGFLYAAVRDNLMRLDLMNEDDRNWRPTILVFSGNPATREDLVSLAVWFESGRGIVFLANILVGDPAELLSRRDTARRQLQSFCRERGYRAFPVVTIAQDLATGMSQTMQLAGMGPIRPNILMFGWPGSDEAASLLGEHLRQGTGLQMNLLLMKESSNSCRLPYEGGARRIDIWWRGRKNGGMMIMLAHLARLNWEWTEAEIRIIRVVEQEAGREPARGALQELIDQARVSANAEVLVSTSSFAQVVKGHSADADLVFLGLEIPEEGREVAWLFQLETMLAGLPTVILVNCKKDTNLLE